MLKFLNGMRAGLMMSAAGVDAGSNAGGGGVLSIDQAAAMIGGLPKEEEQPAAQPAPAPPTQAQPEQPAAQPEAEVEETDPAAQVAQPEAEAEGEEEEQPEATEPLEPPKFWNAQQRERFAALPREAQEVILEHEGLRTAATSKAIQTAAEQRKAFEAGAAKFTEMAAGLDALLPQAEKTFRARWENVDWNAIVDQYGADQALKLKNQFELEQGQLQQLQAAKATADGIKFQKFVTEEETKLRALVPDLADPEKGGERREALGKFLATQGIEPERIAHISAVETSLAYDAMQWRNAQAKAKAMAKQPKTPAPPARQPVRPGSAQQRSTQQTRIEQLSRKRALSVDEAVELMNLKEAPQ